MSKNKNLEVNIVDGEINLRYVGVACATVLGLVGIIGIFWGMESRLYVGIGMLCTTDILILILSLSGINGKSK